MTPTAKPTPKPRDKSSAGRAEKLAPKKLERKAQKKDADADADEDHGGAIAENGNARKRAAGAVDGGGPSKTSPKWPPTEPLPAGMMRPVEDPESYQPFYAALEKALLAERVGR